MARATRARQRSGRSGRSKAVSRAATAEAAVNSSSGASRSSKNYKRDRRPLTKREKRFVESYLSNQSAQQAYVDAGYKAKDARGGSNRLMRRRRILVELVTRMEADELRFKRANEAVDPAVQGGHTIVCYAETMVGKLDAAALASELRTTTVEVCDRNLDGGLEMLTIQAQTLNAIFNELARQASATINIIPMESLLKLALRAQSQCRATWEAISTIQNPPLAGYVMQANIAHGHQQVNNEAFARARHEKAQTKLLEQTVNDPDGWLDRRAPTASGDANSHVEAVEKVDRPEDKKRQG